MALPTVFIVEFDLDQTHEEEFNEFEEGSTEQLALLEKIRTAYESGFARRAETTLGWTLEKAVGNLEPFRTCSLIFNGEGRLEDHDRALMKFSGSEALYFTVVDLTHEITQSYDHGDLETGAIAYPDESDHYAEFARTLGKRLGLG